MDEYEYNQYIGKILKEDLDNMTGHHSAGDMLYDKYIKGNPVREKRVEIFKKISRLSEERYKINQEIRKLRKEIKDMEKEQ